MSNPDIIRAWKDEAFRANLGEFALPENPAGQIELTDESLSEIQGGMIPATEGSICCITFTWWSPCTGPTVGG